MQSNKKELLFISVFILVGIVLLFFGVKSTYSRMEKTKNYVSVEGTFVGSSIYSSDDDGTTYTLTYSYRVNGNRYEISTDYGTGSVPDMGTKKTIKYNPNNPSEAIISGMGSNGFLLIMGFMFTAIPLIILFTSIINREPNNGSVIHKKILTILIGFVFAVMGGAFYYMMCSGGNSLSIISSFKINGFWVIIPILFIIIGIYIIIASIFKKEPVLAITNNDVQNISSSNYEVPVEQQVLEEKINNVANKVEKVGSIVAPISQIIGGLIFILVCGFIFILGGDGFTRIAIVPFLICGLSILFGGVISLIQNITNFNANNNYNALEQNEIINNNLNKLQAINSYVYPIGFLTFWFGFLIFFDYQAIKDINNGGLTTLLFSLIFWAAGISVAYKLFKNKKKQD